MEWDAPDLDFDFLPFERALEGRELPAGRRMIRNPKKRELKKALRLECAAEIMPELPGPGTTVHIVGNGKYDFFDWIPHLTSLIHTPAEFWGSTWTMNRGNALELLALFDAGRLTSITLLTGLYFKRRESAVYATILEGLAERGQRYLAFKNHTKLILLRAPGYDLTVEGSANYTSNPRLEQYAITNDPDLLAFHLEWINELAWNG